jgi:hypothetical protein
MKEKCRVRWRPLSSLTFRYYALQRLSINDYAGKQAYLNSKKRKVYLKVNQAKSAADAPTAGPDRGWNQAEQPNFRTDGGHRMKYR